jgi:membrane protein DedA with SNARE-associated domain
MSPLIDGILGQPGWLVLLVAGLAVLVEDALFVGFVIPGETAALLAGAAAKLGNVHLVGVLVVVVVCAIVGDSVGYEIGRHLGPRVMGLRMLQSRRGQLDDAREFLSRRGASAIFLSRWVAFLRAVMPALAGIARIPYRRFLPWNAAGGIAWGVTVVLLGYAAGASYAQVGQTFGRDVALVVLAVVVVVAWRLRAGRAERRSAGPR